MKLANFDFGHFREERVHTQKQGESVIELIDSTLRSSISPIYHMIYPVCCDGL